MEFSKTEKVDLDKIGVRETARSPLSTRVGNLMPGEGFVVTGIERTNISGAVAPWKKGERSFTIRKIGELKYHVIRIS